MTRRLGILISGRGSNLQAIIDAISHDRLDAEIAIVISNRPGVPGLDRARAADLEALCVDHREFPDRECFDRKILSELQSRDVGLVCLAGFMRLLGPTFVRAYRDAILNIHPSLLPSFSGLEAQRQAVDYGVKVTGVTVHIVDEQLDHGPIVLQTAVAVTEADTPETLAARMLSEEHRLYPEAIGLVLDGLVARQGRRLVARRPAP